ncbi:hypothetical protein H6758_03010 [Candidatus Nomurabacteria bacterium]|nr:hypothetical protein [Candidatus Nomurabacteria bacterium]
MKGVVFENLNDTKRITEKGWNIAIANFATQGVGIFFRKQGIVGGKHYHKGNSPSRTPEHGVLISGKARFICRNLDNGEEQAFDAEAPTSWKIDPMIYHEMHMVTDCVFIEKTHKDDPTDFFYLND